MWPPSANKRMQDKPPMTDAIIWLCEVLLGRRWNADALADEIGTITGKDDGDVTVKPNLNAIAEIVIMQGRAATYPHTLRIMLAEAIDGDQLLDIFGNYTNTPLGADNALMFRLNHPDFPNARLSVVTEGNEGYFHTIVVALSER